MASFYVWDELNGERDEAKTIEASSPEEAAREYAEHDHDGWTDGLYHEHSQPLIVQRQGDHERWRVEVRAEMVPKMMAGEPVRLEGETEEDDEQRTR